MTEKDTSSEINSSASTSVEMIDLIEAFVVLYSRKISIILIALLMFIPAAVYIFQIKNTYRSFAVIYPVAPSRGGSLFDALSSSGLGLGGLAGKGQNPVANQIKILLESKSLATEVYRKMKDELLPVFFEKSWDKINKKWIAGDPTKEMTEEELAGMLKSSVQADFDKTSTTIVVACILTDKKMTAKVVQAYLDALDAKLSSIALTSEKKNVQFLEGQLLDSRLKYLKQMEALKKFYQKNDESVLLDILNFDFNLDDNQDLKISSSGYIDYVRDHLLLLKKVSLGVEEQLGLAKIGANYFEPSYQVIDYPEVPLEKFKPNRKMQLVLAFVLSVSASVFIAIVREYWSRNSSLIRQKLQRELQSK